MKAPQVRTPVSIWVAGVGATLVVLSALAGACHASETSAESPGFGLPEAGQSNGPDGVTVSGAAASAPRSATALAPGLDDYRKVMDLGVTHRLWVLTLEAGRLELRDSRMRLLASERSTRPVLNHAFSPAEGVFDQVFFLRLEAEQEGIGTQRILRARPDRDAHWILRRNKDGRDGWSLLEVEPDEFEQAAVEHAAARDLPREDAEEDLDQELAALIEWDAVHGPAAEPPMAAGDDARRLRDEGMELLGRGEYAAALERLEASLKLMPDTEVADRAARLRTYLQLQGP